MISLAERVAVVTGGASGIGLGIAGALAEAGMHVVVTYRLADRLDTALESLRGRARGRVHAVQLDVVDRGAVARAADEAERVFGKIHVLCNSAGVNQLGAMDEASYGDWDWILGVNLGGTVNCLVTFLPRIKAHGEGGHIVNVASMSSFIPSVQAGIYSASKYAVRGLTESLRLNLAPHRIGVSLVCPGLTRSNIWESPRRRSGNFGNSAFEIDEQRLNRLREVHAVGMDPMEVGRRTLRGILRNELYVFSHPEFREELLEIHEDVMAALPNDEVDPRRLALEQARRAAKAHARSLGR